MNQSQDPEKDEELKEMGILDHLEELRWCITRVVVCLAVIFPFTVYFANDVIDFVGKLSQVRSFIATEPSEPFMQQFRVGFILAIYLALPYTVFQIWKFVSPGLYEKERNWSRYVAVASYVLFLLGSLFGLLVITPISLSFFNSMETETIRYLPRLADSISFILQISVATGLASQLPVAIVILFALGLISIEQLTKVRLYAIVIIFFVAAILTPPDVASQLLLGVPTWLIYELSIIVCRILNIGKDNANVKRSQFMKNTAFIVLFIIVFGGSFGLYYTYQWYQQPKTEKFSTNFKDPEAYRKIFAENGGPQKLAKALSEERPEAEKTTIYSVLLENWQNEKLTNDDKALMVKYLFDLEIIINKSETSHNCQFKVTRKGNIPLNLNFYWQIKINERTFMWQDDDNNLRYSYDPLKQPETIIRDNVLNSLPTTKQFLDKDGEYTLQLILKTVSATNIAGEPISWVDELTSKPQFLTIGVVKKSDPLE